MTNQYCSTEDETLSLESTSQDTNQRVVLMLDAGAQREDNRHHATVGATATPKH